MNRVVVLTVMALPLLFSCASNAPYKPGNRPEKMEFDRDLLDVYPDDVRQNLDLYTNMGVGWAGVIVKTETTEGPDGTIHAVTTFDHHYFDWQEDRNRGRMQLSVSPRGEGQFRTDWEMRLKDPDEDSSLADTYAGPGTLALVYGVPEKVAEDGTVVLRYRYLRLIDARHFNTNEFDYGRFGEPFRYLDFPPK